MMHINIIVKIVVNALIHQRVEFLQLEYVNSWCNASFENVPFNLLCFFFFYINHEVSWGGPQLWEAPLSPYHNPD